MTEQEIAKSLDAMSRKLDTVVKIMADIMRQNAVLYYAINHEDEKADVMSPRKAGWKIQAIADDMGVTYSKVYRVLHEDQEGTGNG